MKKDEILNRLIQKSICINAGGKGCYSPYTNDIDWFSDIDNLILMYEQLQRENQKYKEVIDKIDKYINDYNVFEVFSFPLMKRWEEEQVKSSIDYEFKSSLIKDLKDILKEVE